MLKKTRYVYLIIVLALFSALGFLYEGTFQKLLDSFWFTSGILLLLTLSLIDQPFFTKDSSVFLNSLTAGLSMLFLPPESKDSTYWIILGLVGYLIISSYVMMLLRINPLSDENKYIQVVSKINRILGKPNVLFSILFVYGAFLQYSTSVDKLNSLLVFWAVFTLLDVSGLSQHIGNVFSKKDIKTHSIGTVVGIQADNLITVRLWSGDVQVNLFALVDFALSANKNRHQGLVVEKVVLDQTQLVKVLINSDIEIQLASSIDASAPKLNEVFLIDSKVTSQNLGNVIGFVIEGSSIQSIKFIYKSTLEVYQGEIIEVLVRGKKVIYQILEALICVDKISPTNSSGYMVGEAIQLGIWSAEKRGFDKFGWIPDIYSLVTISTNVDVCQIGSNELLLGCLPNTKYPVIINKEIAITHHMAILGVTGTGKSVFTRNLLREYMKDGNIKIICIDFTGEYSIKFTNPAPCFIVSSTHRDEIITSINKIELEMSKFADKRNQVLIDTENASNDLKLTQDISSFLQSSQQLSIFDLPEVENTAELTLYTRSFIKNLFKIAKTSKNYQHRVCLVLEEAHTIVPEWNFAGSSDKASQNVINSIAQIALQGRKYDIGLLVVAQRTANVSKTILTQCNSVISFQEFDNTSIDFLSNYFGNSIAETLPSLPFRRAIASGKAFKTSVPMMFEVPEINE